MKTFRVRLLYDDTKDKALDDDKRIALSAVVFVLIQGKRLEEERRHLEKLCDFSPLLKDDLQTVFKSTVESDDMRRDRAEMHKIDIQQRKKEEKEKESWREFGELIRKKPSFSRSRRSLNRGRRDSSVIIG